MLQIGADIEQEGALNLEEASPGSVGATRRTSHITSVSMASLERTGILLTR